MWRLKDYIDTFGMTSRIHKISILSLFTKLSNLCSSLYMKHVRDLSFKSIFLIYFSLLHIRLSNDRLLICACYIFINNIILYYTLNYINEEFCKSIGYGWT